MNSNKEVEIIIVEDDPNDQELVMRVFRKHNLVNKLLLMKDGVEALDFLFGRNGCADNGNICKPKVIFLDLKMPRIDGLEVLRRIKEDKRTSQIPVVILTGSKEERDLKSSYALGVNSYVTKPLKFEQFATAVSQLGLYWLLLNEPPVR